MSNSTLFAIDATNLANEFYDSTKAGKRDIFGPVVHFEMPIVADGRLYVPGQTQLTVLGQKPGDYIVGRVCHVGIET